MPLGLYSHALSLPCLAEEDTRLYLRVLGPQGHVSCFCITDLYNLEVWLGISPHQN